MVDGFYTGDFDHPRNPNANGTDGIQRWRGGYGQPAPSTLQFDSGTEFQHELKPQDFQRTAPGNQQSFNSGRQDQGTSPEQRSDEKPKWMPSYPSPPAEVAPINGAPEPIAKAVLDASTHIYQSPFTPSSTQYTSPAAPQEQNALISTTPGTVPEAIQQRSTPESTSSTADLSSEIAANIWKRATILGASTFPPSEPVNVNGRQPGTVTDLNPPSQKQAPKPVDDSETWLEHAKRIERSKPGFWIPEPMQVPNGSPAAPQALNNIAAPGRAQYPLSDAHPGINISKTIINTPDPETVKDALYSATDVHGQLLAAGALGAGINTGKFGLDLALSKGFFPWWKDSSPLRMQLEQEYKTLDAAIADASAKTTAVAEAIKAAESSSTGSAQTAASQARLFADITKSQQEESLANIRVASLTDQLLAREKGGLSFLGWQGQAAKGFLTGALVSGATMGAGTLADSLLGGNPKMTGSERFLIDGLLVPGTMLTSQIPLGGGKILQIPLRYRWSVAIPLFIAARAMGYFDSNGPTLSKSSLLLRPNEVDSLGLTFAALGPKDIRTKLAFAAITLVAGRLYNLAAHEFGWGGKEGNELDAAASAALETDRQEKTTQSFDNAVDSYRDLCKLPAGEVKTQMKVADLANSQSSMAPVDFLRQHAILFKALGMTELEKGSRIVDGGDDAVAIYGSNSRILEKDKYDFLGEATIKLALSYNNLTDLRLALYNEKSKVNSDGSSSDSAKSTKLAALDSQMNQCDEERLKLDKTLKSLFGPFDIEKIFGELTEAARKRPEMYQALQKSAEMFGTMGPQLPRQISAKMARDLALGYLALAQYTTAGGTFSSGGDAGSADTLYKSALAMLQKARSLEPDNPNMDKIDTIANRVGATIGPSLSRQYQSHWNNPFQLNIPKY